MKKDRKEVRIDGDTLVIGNYRFPKGEIRGWRFETKGDSPLERMTSL